MAVPYRPVAAGLVSAFAPAAAIAPRGGHLYIGGELAAFPGILAFR
jgi:hypothetical protein